MDMEGLGLDIPSVQCRSFYPSHSSHSVSVPTVYSTANRSTSLMPESLKTFAPLSGTTSTSNPSVGLGCSFGNYYYGCTIPQNTGLQKNAHACLGGRPMEKPTDISGFGGTKVHYDDITGMTKESGVYQGYAGSYPNIPGYIDVPVVPRAGAVDPRPDIVFPIEGYQLWNWRNSWKSQLYGSKEQTQGSHIWKSSLAGEASLNQPDINTSCPLRKKKRVPYTKLQLKELEREYAASKFITKDKRRRIASSTSLTERQITIWFQNRRVKDKKTERLKHIPEKNKF